MRVTVRLFARLKDLAGTGELIRDVPAPATVQTVWTSLTAEMPSLVEYEGTMSVAVNAEYARMAAAVHDGDEVAFLPPVSGGSSRHAKTGDDFARCTISERPLDAEAVAARVAGADAGGVVSFIGAVRDHARGRAIRHLEYEAYPAMALVEMERICDAAAQSLLVTGHGLDSIAHGQYPCL